MPHFTPTDPASGGAFHIRLEAVRTARRGIPYASFHFGLGQAARAHGCRHCDDLDRRLDDFFRFGAAAAATACGAQAGARATRDRHACPNAGTSTDAAGSASAACAARAIAAWTAR